MVKGLGDALGILDDFRDAAQSGTGLRGKAARAACDAYAGNPTAGAMISASNQGFGVGMRYGCKPYWDGPEGYDPPTPPGSEPSITGGQCPGVPYDLFRTRQPTPETEVEDEILSTSNLFGPLNVTNVVRGVELDEETGLSVYTFDVVRAGVLFTSSQTSSVGPPSFRAGRVDGLDDDCGDGEPVYTPPSPGFPPSGTGFGDPRDIGEPGEPYVITPRPPRIGPDGKPFMPFDTPTGPVPFRPDGEPPFVPPPPVEGEPEEVSGGGDIDADPERDITEGQLIGYRFTVRDSSPGFQSVIPGTVPRIYSRVVGSIQLKLGSESGTIYSGNLQITSEEGSIVRKDTGLRVVGCSYNCLPSLDGLTLKELRVKQDDS